jgi:uncharacterized protein (DUF1499 family)
MARPPVFSEPTSRLAIWARRFAVFSAIAAVLSVIIMQSGVLEIRPALATFGGALVVAGIALLLAFAAFAVIWKDGLAGMAYALWAILVASSVLAYPGYLAYRAYSLPWIYDITTDPIDPPRYEALARVRPRDANPIAYAGLYSAELQRAAYPDLDPLESDANPQLAFEAAQAVVARLRWRVVDERPPIKGQRDGRIEAVARTPVMGFRDDVVIRIRANGDGSKIDARSSSRYGAHDLGTNATRIRSLMEAIDEMIADRADQPPRQQQQQQQQKQQKQKRGQPPAKR